MLVCLLAEAHTCSLRHTCPALPVYMILVDMTQGTQQVVWSARKPTVHVPRKSSGKNKSGGPPPIACHVLDNTLA